MGGIGFVIGLIVAALVVWAGKAFSVSRTSRGELSDVHVKGGLVALAALLFVSLWALASGVIIVKTGTTGVVLRMGAMTSTQLNEGPHFVIPMVDKVEIMSAQVHAYKDKASAASKDMQTVTTQVTLNYQLQASRCADIYRIMRNDYEVRVIAPAMQESIKAATARYDAESLISKREEVRTAIKDLLVAKLTKAYGIEIRDISITDFDFSKDFNAAIEAKAKMTQETETAKRAVERVKMEMEQKVAQARAEAESLRLQRAQLTPEMLQARWIEKWNGVLPETVVVSGDGKNNLMLNLPTKAKAPTE